MTKDSAAIRPIAFYLPQYHPIPENNKWWGEGFTEWTNVVKAKPMFKGHYQPHLPADLGFYDLRLPEVREAQANLARQYGIYGFCYYHYWFNGRRLLERPFNEVLESGKPNFPFCLCWANESWSRRWDGSEKEILMEQVYSEEDDKQHMQWLVKAFQDPRYIRVDDKPLFLVYRASKIPNLQKTVSIWREEAFRLGVGDIFLCKVESCDEDRGNPGIVGFDASGEFQPDWSNLGRPLLRDDLGITDVVRSHKIWNLLKNIGMANEAYVKHDIYDYKIFIDRMLERKEEFEQYKRFPCVTPSWDNVARRKYGATILSNSTPEIYEYWLRQVIKKVDFKGIIFINAWNEWAEGNHLEPDLKWGRAYLQATLNAINADS